MLLKKKDFPEEDELVLCTVTKLFPHGVFVNLDEYDKGGMIHISEVSPGRIRNIRDFVKEGKKVVCKILRVDPEKGHIDLSLRRVNERQKKEKVNEIKQEQKAEKIIEFTAKKLDTGFNKLYNELSSKIMEKYDLVYLCFEEVVNGKISFDKLGIEPKTAEVLTELVKDRMKPPEVFVGGELTLKSYAPDGIEIIKNALNKGASKNITIVYEGGGKYDIEAKSNEYKDAEKILESATTKIIDFIENQDGEGSFVRKE